MPHHEATIHVLSHAVQRGSTVFDVLRVEQLPNGPAAVGLREHVARFDRSMDLMGMEPALGIAELEEAVAQTVQANPGSNLVKLVAAWHSKPASTLPDTVVPQLTVAALNAGMSAPSTASAVRACSATGPKMPPEVLPPSLKVAAAYTYGIRQKMAAKAEGFDEIILRLPTGELAEAVSQSLFVVRGEDILVPPLDVVLDGITRRLALDVAGHLGLKLLVRGIDWEEVETADELFLCSTTNPVLPLSELDGRALTERAVSNRLGEAIEQLLAGDHELSARWLTPLS